MASYFSLQYYCWIKHKGHENKGNDQPREKLVMVEQILLVRTIRNVYRTVGRICIPILGFKRIFRSFLRPTKGSLSAIIFLAVFRLKKPSKIVHIPSFGTICSSRWDCLFFRQRSCWVQMKSSWGSEKDLWQVQWLE